MSHKFYLLACLFLLQTELFAQLTNTNIKDPVIYFQQRTEAFYLAENQNWSELIPLLENLTEQYQLDGDLFYMLGIALYETKDYQKAIPAFMQTLDLGGTIISVPTGSRPSNDIMIKIAKAYALEGDRANALLWLKKGIAARYDEKFHLIGDPAFNTLSEEVEFLDLFGLNGDGDLPREEAWQADLNYLQRRIVEVHYAIEDVLPKAELQALFDDLIASIERLTDEQILVEIMKIMGRLESGHNLIIPTSVEHGALRKLPIDMYQFDDGMFIVDAEAGYEEWIGYKIEKIADTPIGQALLKTDLVNAKDNAMQRLWLGPYFLLMPDVLKGLGIIERTDKVSLTLSDDQGKREELILEPVSWNFRGFPTIPQIKKDDQPLYLSDKNTVFWYRTLPELKASYIQFNSVQDKEEQSLEAFTQEVERQIDQDQSRYLILDLRHNAGGDGSIRKHMLKLLVRFEARYPEGKVFVLMGRGTYSAAQNLLTEISVHTNAVLVGEPSSSKPSFVGEAGWFQLPYSGLLGIVSSQYHKSSAAEDFRHWIAPHLPISLSSSDYFNGYDKAMEAIKELIQLSERP